MQIKIMAYIKPELVEIGDLVSVKYPADGGITVTKSGRVAKRMDHNNVRHMLTAEGATLFSWDPTSKSEIRITLIERQAQPQETLWDIAI